MRTWHLHDLDVAARHPQVLSSSPAARVIVLVLAPGEALAEHQVHERAWFLVVAGDVAVITADGVTQTGGTGFLVEFAPAERHAVRTVGGVRGLLLLAPWPGPGHPRLHDGRRP